MDTQIVFDELQKMTDEDLCALVRAGCRDAEDVLAVRYSRTVRRLARPYFLAGGDSEDLIQEGMLGLISAIREFDGQRSGFPTFAALCVKRRIYTAIRDAQGKKNDILNMALSFEQIGCEDAVSSFPVSDLEHDPERFVIGQETAVMFAASVEQLLSAFEKKVLMLYLDGFSYSEMSDRLNRPTKSIDNAVQRIRKKLAHLLR